MSKQSETKAHYDHQGREADPVNEECGGHDMSDIDKEGTITKGGFYSIDIDLEPNILAELVDSWANVNLHKASLEIYTEVMEDTGNQVVALHRAVVNDIILDVLKEKIAREEAKLDANSTDV